MCDNELLQIATHVCFKKASSVCLVLLFFLPFGQLYT